MSKRFKISSFFRAFFFSHVSPVPFGTICIMCNTPMRTVIINHAFPGRKMLLLLLKKKKTVSDKSQPVTGYKWSSTPSMCADRWRRRFFQTVLKNGPVNKSKPITLIKVEPLNVCWKNSHCSSRNGFKFWHFKLLLCLLDFSCMVVTHPKLTLKR